MYISCMQSVNVFLILIEFPLEAFSFTFTRAFAIYTIII